MSLVTLRKKLIPCSVIALSLFHMDWALAAADERAEQVASMYLSTMVNGDIEEAKKLNDALRSMFEGQDAFDINALKELPDSMASDLTEQLMQQFSDKQKAALKTPVTDFTHALVAAILRSKCTVQGSDVSDNDAQEGNKIAAIRYACQVPDVANKVRALTKKIGKKPLSAAYFTELTSIYQNAPLAGSVKGSANLYSGEKAGEWFTGSPNELSTPVVEALAGPLIKGAK
ncbi:hypothetical protein [Niveibacterium terrae]|uniref:hypothetical protein n=1 Tax=Niveibacterium terrae TaxID=3373598 RepID=UPI003A8F1E17